MITLSLLPSSTPFVPFRRIFDRNGLDEKGMYLIYRLNKVSIELFKTNIRHVYLWLPGLLIWDSKSYRSDPYSGGL